MKSAKNVHGWLLFSIHTKKAAPDALFRGTDPAMKSGNTVLQVQQ